MTDTPPRAPVPSAARAPAMPPTPSVPLSALLAREDLALRQLAGPAASGVVLHGAHTSEMADPYPYLLGGELLLTAGVHIPATEAGSGSGAGAGTGPGSGLGSEPGPGPGSGLGSGLGSGPGSGLGSGPGSGLGPEPGPGADLDAYAARVVAAGGAALGFGLAPVHDIVPRALVAACTAHGLPLIEVPPRTTFAAVARAVWQLVAQARNAELRRVTEAQQSLAAAAARPDPVPAVLRQLARRVGGARAVLYGPQGTEIAGAGRPPAAPVAEALARLTRVVTGRSSSTTATDTVSGVQLTAYALGAGQGFVLGVAAPRRDPGDHTVASVAAVLLSLLTGEHQSATEAARSSALVRLLLGAEPAAVAPLLRGDPAGAAGPWLVVHARPLARPADQVAAAGLGAALGSALVDLVDRGAGADGVVRVLMPAVREPGPQPGWRLGVSAPVGPGEWPAADTQAARALTRARASRALLVRHGPRPALTDLVPPDQAEAHARALLAPVADTPALADTLRAWLSLHGSWDRTAVALSVHRNTVRQRIARCAALLETDLDDPDVRMELWFALRRC
ncbi:helix-turn-helix domain-containing protein [Streptomyces sp. NPDC091377]|uniref:helix-turn-helix domain-containing protein n=1 Tax=Streptomyces sp. NPDC091377 TaxID=3365995 RepID=UPI00380859DC